MSEVTIGKVMQAYAQDAVDFARKAFQIELDFSPDKEKGDKEKGDILLFRKTRMSPFLRFSPISPACPTGADRSWEPWRDEKPPPPCLSPPSLSP